MEILKVENLIKTYGKGETKVNALDGVSFSVEKGEFVAIVGASGSGKSTLLHIWGGVDKPTSGKVNIDGTDIYSLSNDNLAIFRRRQIGLIYQFYNLIPILNVEENISLPVLLDGKKIDKNKLNEIVTTLGLEKRVTHLPNQLSGGQQQRVSIGRSLINNPSIILADEPTGNLDSKNSKEIVELLKFSNKKYNQTLIMITHDPQIALEADRIITIETVKIAKLTEKAPFGVNTSEWVNIMGIVNENTYNKMLEKMEKQSEDEGIYISTKKNSEVSKQLKEISENYANLTISIYDAEATMKDEKNLKLIIQIFLYGFIALISAIGISNIFNTISTNIGLRKREFANLKSIGMTNKQFNKMLNLECVFYGTKALLYGLPLGALMCYIINQSFESGFSVIFKLPWSSIVISIIAVYIIVFLTMIYSSKKMKKQNIIEALRDDNI